MRKAVNYIGKLVKNTWIANFVENLFNILNNKKIGYSAKKVTAIVILVCVVIMHVCYCKFALANADFSLFATILGVDFATILTLFGINEYNKVQINKSQKTDKDNEIKE
jgi:hypothetical protein